MTRKQYLGNIYLLYSHDILQELFPKYWQYTITIVTYFKMLFLYVNFQLLDVIFTRFYCLLYLEQEAVVIEHLFFKLLCHKGLYFVYFLRISPANVTRFKISAALRPPGRYPRK